MEEVNMDKVNEYIHLLPELIIKYGPSLIGAVLVWFVGSWVVKMMSRGFAVFLEKRKIDESLKPFLKSLINVALRVLLVLTVLGTVGVEMTSFIALLAAAGIAIGMALSGTLQNFAGGVVILLFRPFKVGDFVEIQSYMGTVKEIQIFSTILTTPDNKTIYVPNGPISSGNITNFTNEPIRRVEWKFGIAYGDNVDKARSVINKLLDEDVRVLSEPVRLVAVSSLGDSSVNMVVRAWVKSPDYWDIFFDLNEKVYKAFGSEGINIPFPQMDVHIRERKAL